MIATLVLICAASATASSAVTTDSVGTPASTDGIPALLTAETAHDRYVKPLMLKTNIIPWGAGIMNIEGEIGLTDHLSLDLPIWYCPWFIADRHALRVAAFQPEGRWWFSSTGHGHFAGVHLSLAWYNLKWGDYRYQDNSRPLLGAGLTYGYALNLNDIWGLEFSIGAGVFNLTYDRFYNVPNGQLSDSRHSTYFGIDHLSVSLVYHLTY